MKTTKCPYCKFEGEDCDFPDFFYTDCGYQEQYNILQEIQDEGYNIVNCGNCGDVFLTKLHQID